MPRKKPRPLYQSAPALHMLSFENFVKSMPPNLSELKVTPSFCFTFKIPDDVAASNIYANYMPITEPNVSRSHGNQGYFFYRYLPSSEWMRAGSN